VWRDTAREEPDGTNLDVRVETRDVARWQ
jgi:hypothetical protein